MKLLTEAEVEAKALQEHIIEAARSDWKAVTLIDKAFTIDTNNEMPVTLTLPLGVAPYVECEGKEYRAGDSFVVNAGLPTAYTVNVKASPYHSDLLAVIGRAIADKARLMNENTEREKDYTPEDFDVVISDTTVWQLFNHTMEKPMLMLYINAPESVYHDEETGMEVSLLSKVGVNKVAIPELAPYFITSTCAIEVIRKFSFEDKYRADLRMKNIADEQARRKKVRTRSE